MFFPIIIGSLGVLFLTIGNTTNTTALKIAGGIMAFVGGIWFGWNYFYNLGYLIGYTM
jgi:uncharacterized membrane protein YjjP (DUF1212 family)